MRYNVCVSRHGGIEVVFHQNPHKHAFVVRDSVYRAKFTHRYTNSMLRCAVLSQVMHAEEGPGTLTGYFEIPPTTAARITAAEVAYTATH